MVGIISKQSHGEFSLDVGSSLVNMENPGILIQEYLEMALKTLNGKNWIRIIR